MGSVPIGFRCFPSKGAFATESTNNYRSHCTKLRVFAWPSLPPSWDSLQRICFFKGGERRGWACREGKSRRRPPPEPRAYSQNPGLLKNLFLDAGPIPAKTNASRVYLLLPWVVVALCNNDLVILRFRGETPCRALSYPAYGGEVSTHPPSLLWFFTLTVFCSGVALYPNQTVKICAVQCV